MSNINDLIFEAVMKGKDINILARSDDGEIVVNSFSLASDDDGRIAKYQYHNRFNMSEALEYDRDEPAGILDVLPMYTEDIYSEAELKAFIADLDIFSTEIDPPSDWNETVSDFILSTALELVFEC